MKAYPFYFTSMTALRDTLHYIRLEQRAWLAQTCKLGNWRGPSKSCLFAIVKSQSLKGVEPDSLRPSAISHRSKYKLKLRGKSKRFHQETTSGSYFDHRWTPFKLDKTANYGLGTNKLTLDTSLTCNVVADFLDERAAGPVQGGRQATRRCERGE